MFCLVLDIAQTIALLQVSSVFELAQGLTAAEQQQLVQKLSVAT